VITWKAHHIATGALACRRLVRIVDNPHVSGSEQARLWALGWRRHAMVRKIKAWVLSRF
jgi:hypothetical protein